MVQQLFNHCRDRKIHYRDRKIHCHNKVLSFDCHYVATLISLSQHLSFNFSHFVSRQSCEMSQQSLLLTLSSASILLRHGFCWLCCDILKLCRDISALANFMPLFLLDFLLLHSKSTKHKVGEYSIIQHLNKL